MTVIIGLTGSIGTGKSMISKRFKALSIPVVDADIIAREVVEPGELALENIVASFGEKVLHEDGTLNRQALGSIVFGDKENRETLNSIIHPEIRKEMIRQRDTYVAENHSCVVMDIPLLFESKLTHYVDKILVVAVNEDVQLQRMIERDGSTEAEAKQRINAQISVKEKAEQADAVIDNNGTIQASYEQLNHILDTWRIR